MATTRFDSLEQEEFQRMLASESWRTFWRRVEMELQRATERCTRADGAVELRQAQGAYRALAAVTGMPQQILTEMRARKR